MKDLIEALLELRELAPSGSAEMAIIDEALEKVGVRPWSIEHDQLILSHENWRMIK